MVELAYQVKCWTVNPENRVRAPISPKICPRSFKVKHHAFNMGKLERYQSGIQIPPKTLLVMYWTFNPGSSVRIRMGGLLIDCLKKPLKTLLVMYWTFNPGSSVRIRMGGLFKLKI
jgi:hypothetical protein